MTKNMLEFKSVDDAWRWMRDEVIRTEKDHNIDNERFFFLDDPYGAYMYKHLEEGGCCGSAEFAVKIDGRKAMIGCNYGH